jgi:hypothetical protein
MDTSQTIHKLKVAVSQVKHFPFDIVYIVDQSLQDLLPRLFPYSLVLPLNNDLVRRLSRVDVDETGSITACQKSARTPADVRHGRAMLSCLISEETLRRSFLVVPVLPRIHARTRSKRRKDRNPAYLVANRYRAGNFEKVGRGPFERVITRDAPFFHFFNDAAVMFTPRGPKQPVCLMCPRHLEHVQGKCFLGEQVCYESLVIQPQRERSREQL